MYGSVTHFYKGFVNIKMSIIQNSKNNRIWVDRSRVHLDYYNNNRLSINIIGIACLILHEMGGWWVVGGWVVVVGGSNPINWI